MIRKLLILTTSVFFLFSISASAQMRNFVGNWRNTSSVGGVTRVRITTVGNRAYAQAWGKCTPTDCDWGRKVAAKYTPNISSNRVSALSARFRTEGISKFVIFKILSRNRLQAEVFTTFAGGDGRSNYVKRHTFQKTGSVGVLRAPVLVSPRNGARLTRLSRRTTLDWQTVLGATSYGVEIQYYDRSDRRWVGNYITRRVPTSQYTFTFLGDQPGRWRVWANRGVAGRKSGWRTFSYSTGSGVLRAPVLISPRSGAALSNLPRRTILRWRRVTGAIRYRVEVQYYVPSRNRWINHRSGTVSAPVTVYTFSFIGARPGRWRVWAISRSGAAGRKSGWRTFRYTR